MIEQKRIRYRFLSVYPSIYDRYIYKYYAINFPSIIKVVKNLECTL